MLIRIFAILLALAGLSRAATVTDFSDIQYWVGSGTNEAAMVLQWNDGKSPVSLAWGFRWDGVATGFDMIQAIDAADSRLSVVVNPDFPTAVFGIFYDVDGTGGTFTPGSPGVFGVSDDVAGTVSDPNDHYQNGWASLGFWEYYASGGSFDTENGPNTYPGSSSLPGTNGTPDWISSWSGASDRELSNGSWDAWDYAPGFASETLDIPTAAVPEPGTAALICLSGGLLVWRLRKVSWRASAQN